MPFIDDKAPKKPKRLKKVWTEDGYMLFWKAPKGKHWDDVAINMWCISSIMTKK